MATKKKTRRRGDYEQLKGKGWYAMHRGWQDHPIFGNEPFTKREAWEWLISNAIFSHDGKLHYLSGSQVLIMRGQLTYSHSFMAEAWGWDDSKVGRFLKRFQRAGMVEVGAECGQTVITICNYNQYQIPYGFVETESEGPAKERRRKAETNNKKGNKDKNNSVGGSALRASSHATPPPSEKLEPWQRELKKELGEAAYNAWILPLHINAEGYLCGPTEFIVGWCRDRYEAKIHAAIQNAGIEFKGLRVAANKNESIQP